MVKNIDKLKDLFEKGYKIIDIKDSSGKKTVILERSPKKITISDSSPEFFAYVSCFKKVKDKYNNFYYAYIYDPFISGVTEINEEELAYIKGDYAIKLSGRCFNKGINISLLKTSLPGKKKSSIKKIIVFDINLEINPEFHNCDLKDEIEMFREENNELVFRGVIKESSVDSRKARLVTQDYSLKLNSFVIRRAEAKSLSLMDQLSILVSPVDKLRLGNIEGNYDTTFRDFIIIVPVKNLILNGNLKIGNIEFYQDFNTLDDSFIKNSDTGRDTPDWSGNYPRARVTIRANQFLLALQEGYSKISTAIDLIALRNDLSFPRLDIDGKYEFFNFDYYKFLSKVKTPSWIYCREKYTNSYIILDQDFLKEHVLALEYRADEYFKIINKLFSSMLNKNTLSQSDKNLLQVLRWLRRAIQSGDNRDKLLDLWTAMEFLISGTKITPLFCDTQIKSIKSLLKSNLTLTDEQQSALLSKISMLNDAPLRAKIEALEIELGVNFSPEEKELLSITRRKRNDIIHGKEDAEVFENELNKLRSIIERLLIGKVSSADK